VSTQPSGGTAAETSGRANSRQRALKSIWERGQRGWPESSPLVQFPNAPLLVAIGGFGVAVATDGSARDYALATGYTALAVWAGLEVTSGQSPARRLVGAAGLVFVVVKVGEALGG
jgi:hypothetical protein